MHRISKPLIRDDALEKSSGKAVYTSDINPSEMLHLVILSSGVQHAEITGIKKPDLPEGYFIIGPESFTGRNRAAIVAVDWPFFAETEVMYYGQPLLAFAGPDEAVCRRLCRETQVSFKTLPAVADIDEAVRAGIKPFNDYSIVKGDPDRAFKNASVILENEYRTGMQEQAYMEPQAMIADWDGEILTLRGSMQCPYYIRNSLSGAFNINSEKIRVIQEATGGAFGGKEDYPSIIAGHVAAAAIASGKPVKSVLDRRSDMMLTPKRHPSLIRIKTALDPDNNITAMDIDCLLDAGAYQSLSGVVLERAVFISTGAYNIENIRIRGRTMMTNHVPSGAFRGFGGPQALFAAERNIDFIAGETGLSPSEIRKRYMYRRGDRSVTGGLFRDDIKLDEMLEIIEKASDYSSKFRRYEKIRFEGSSGPAPLRGIGLSIAAHGGGFTGNGEQELIKGKVRIVSGSGRVTISVSNVEMGQGASLTLRKIVAERLKIPVDRVYYSVPDTFSVPDSGPTVASRTIMIVGKLLLDSSDELLPHLDADLQAVHNVERCYVHPNEFQWDEKTFSGDAYPGYSWAVNVVEVEIDPLSYETRVTGSWAVYDVGTPIDYLVLLGQMQGGTAQALGWVFTEKMNAAAGAVSNASFTDYTIPTSLDLPDTECFFIDNPYRYGPFGAKAAGELPNEGPAGAAAAAISQAIGKQIYEIPITPEKLEALFHE